MIEGIWSVAGMNEYHADRECISHSSLEHFRRSPSGYNQKYNCGISGSGEDAAWLILGSLLHAFVLERHKFDAMFAIAPRVDGRTKSGKAELLIFEASVNGRTVITADQAELMHGMAESLRSSPIAGPLLFDSPGRNELAVRWQDECGVWLKCSFDRLLDCGIDLNLKTSRDPSPESWSRDAFRFGYHRQSELYRRGKEKFFPSGETFHVVVGTEPPHQVAVYEIGINEIMLAKEENDHDLASLAQRRASSDWSEQWQKDITTITFPRYAFPSDRRKQ
jgi:hypothetical protein